MSQQSKYVERSTRERLAWHGWVAFAAGIMVINGLFNVIQGLTALFNDEYYLVSKDRLLTFDFTAWGWIQLILGIVLIVVGIALFSEPAWAVVTAICIVTVNMLAQFAFVSAYPVWTIIVITLDLLVLWALFVHGGEYAD